jgi:hypothetical protein
VATVSRDDLHQMIDALGDAEVATARRLLIALTQPENRVPADRRTDSRASDTLSRHPSAVVHAPPITSIDDLHGDFWPADEDPDEFAATIRRWRDEDVSDRLRR